MDFLVDVFKHNRLPKLVEENSRLLSIGFPLSKKVGQHLLCVWE